MARNPSTIDKLVVLARGDPFLVQRAIRMASAGEDRADLGKVMRLVLALRDNPPTAPALPASGGPSNPDPTPMVGE